MTEDRFGFWDRVFERVMVSAFVILMIYYTLDIWQGAWHLIQRTFLN